MTKTNDVSTPLVRKALATARDAEAETEHLWELTPAQRLASFYRGELNLRQCLAWARRHPKEPPLAPDGEWLFIAWKTPEWADDPTIDKPARKGREL